MMTFLTKKGRYGLEGGSTGSVYSVLALVVLGAVLITATGCGLFGPDVEEEPEEVTEGQKSAVIGEDEPAEETTDWRRVEEKEPDMLDRVRESGETGKTGETDEEMGVGKTGETSSELERLDEPIKEERLKEKERTEEKEDDRTEITGWLRVSEFKFSYLALRADFPPVERIIREPVTLGVHEKGYTAPYQVEDGSTERVDLRETFSEERGYFTPRAIREITSHLVRRLKEQEFMGVMVSPHPEDISPDGTDRRTDRTSLRLLFHIARVGGVRSIAQGERLLEEDEKEDVNHPAHRWIREQSPVSEKEVMKRKELRDYVHWLNLHPGRRVDLEVTGVEDQEEAMLGYRIKEDRPWTVFSQISDTGTEQSGRIQTRVGGVHNQITGSDDILSVNYVASGLDDEIKRVDGDLGDLSPDFQAANVSYERPLLYPGSRTRLEVVGRWNKFTASDVGLPGNDFLGETWSLGSQVNHNLWQWEDYFVDGYAGLTFKRDRVENELTGIRSSEPFLVPGIGLEGETSSQSARTSWRIGAEWNMDSVVDTDRDGVERLGRVNADSSWKKLLFDYRQSLYLEPLLNENWNDPSTPGSTLAHEIQVRARGQLGLDRMNPNELFVAGGMYSVRGYPESAVSADSGFTSTVEYRFHLPRVLPIEREPATIPWFDEEFRRAPQNVFGMPDWDWVFKAFLDYGAVEHEDRIEGVESDETLMSVGLGTEVQFRENVRFRVDYGWPLRDLEQRGVESGDREAHFLFTVMY